MNLMNIILKKDHPKGFGFKIQDKDGLLFVSQVSNNGAAYESGMRCGDIIHSIDKEIIKCSSSEFVIKMNEISNDVQLQVYRDNNNTVAINDQFPRSISNVSRELDQISSTNIEKLSISTPSFELNNNNELNDRILNVSYVPEEHIYTYLQPGSAEDIASNDNIDSFPKLIIRKQAYKKSTFEPFYTEPRLSVKKATKSFSVYTKEPTYTVKRRLNSKMGDVVSAVSNLNQIPRRSAPLESNNQNLELSPNNSYNSNSNPITPLVSIEDNSCPSISSMTSSVLSLSESNQVETMVKIISFKEKLKKTNWFNYRIESDRFGVLFECIDQREFVVANNNSTAVDLYISGVEMFMRVWHVNNTTSKFFLPIGQESFDRNIERWTNADNIIIHYGDLDLDLHINHSRLSEDKVSTLFSLLGMKADLQDLRQTQQKPKKIHVSADIIKQEPRKSKTSKNSGELPKDWMLSNLPQIKEIENVPVVVIICANIVEKLGLKNEGIFRKSGNEAAKRKLESVTMNQSTETWAECEEWNNVNTVCSLLKSILRNYSLIDRDTAIKLSMINLGSESSQHQAYMDMVYHLRQHLCKTDPRMDQMVRDKSPPEVQCRLETFKYLLRHLHKVSQYSATNLMTADNLATCFSPTIIEEIPCDDEAEYQTSKKSDADKNLKQMVTFWITNSYFICEMLEEDEEVTRLDKLSIFCKSMLKETQSEESLNSAEELQKDDVPSAETAKDIIEYYASQVVVPGSDSGSISMTDGNMFARSKQPNVYQSFKKKETSGRKSLSNSSPQEMRKVQSQTGDINIESVAMKPVALGWPKRNDNWSSKSVRGAKRKEPLMPMKKELLSLTGMERSQKTMNVPVMVEVCVDMIEKYGLDVDGMYRVSGKKQDINTLESILINNHFSTWADDTYVTMWSNLYTVSGLLKSIVKQFCLIKKEKWVHMFAQFNEKMEPADLRKVLMEAAYHLRNETKKQKEMTITDDDIRSATLRYILRHLKLVSRHERNNRMASNSLAICFMPVLLEEDDSGDIMSISNKGIQITEKLIDHCDWIFQWDDRPWQDIVGKEMSDSLDEYLKTYSTTAVNCTVPSLYNDVGPQHIIDSTEVRHLLKRHMRELLNRDRTSVRRHSDDIDSGVRKAEYRKSKIFDDSQLPNKFTAANYDDVDYKYVNFS